MSKRNTIYTAIAAIAAIAAPAQAGQPYGGGHVVAVPKQSTSGAHPRYDYSYQQAPAPKVYSAPSHGGVPYDGVKGLYDAPRSEVVCVLQGNEIPCSHVPGLHDALIGQGMGHIADQLPFAATGASSSYVQSGPVYASSIQRAPQQSVRYVRQYSSGTVQTGYNMAGPEFIGQQIAISPLTHAASPCGGMIPVAVEPGYLPPCPIQQPRRLTVQLIDGTSFALNGGVGAGIYGEFYGGGGTIVGGDRAFSGVLNAAASQFTFNQRVQRPMPKMKPRYPKPKPRTPHGPKGGYHGGKGGKGHGGKHH